MARKDALTAAVLIPLLIAVLLSLSPSFAVNVDWSPDARLTYDDKDDWMPSVTTAVNGDIWVVWRKTELVGSGFDYNVYYKVYNGLSWSNDTRLTWDSISEDTYPEIMAASDGKIWVVWTSNKTGDQNLFYKVLDGAAWSNDTQLTTHLYADVFPSIMQSGDGKIWVVWTSNRVDLQADLFYKVFDGAVWSEDTQLTADSNTDETDPSIAQAGDGLIWVVFIKTHNSKGADVYYKLFNGTSWSVDVQLTWDTHFDLHPSVLAAEDGTIWVVWDSDRNEHDENVYYKVFDGVWSPDTKLTTNLAVDEWPSITQAVDQTFWVMWGSMRIGNFDIYYKTSIGYERHDVAITNVTFSPSIVRRSENVSIQVTVQNQGTAAETFEVAYYANSTLVTSRTVSLLADETDIVQLDWDTSEAARGNYTIISTVETVAGETDINDNFLTAGGYVEVRLMGDITGMFDGVLLPIPDGVVDLDDFLVVAMPGHIWTEYPTWDPVWGPVCDINRDGRVGIDDLMVISLHFEET